MMARGSRCTRTIRREITGKLTLQLTDLLDLMGVAHPRFPDTPVKLSIDSPEHPLSVNSLFAAIIITVSYPETIDIQEEEFSCPK